MLTNTIFKNTCQSMRMATNSNVRKPSSLSGVAIETSQVEAPQTSVQNNSNVINNTIESINVSVLESVNNGVTNNISKNASRVIRNKQELRSFYINCVSLFITEYKKHFVNENEVRVICKRDNETELMELKNNIERILKNININNIYLDFKFYFSKSSFSSLAKKSNRKIKDREDCDESQQNISFCDFINELNILIFEEKISGILDLLMDYSSLNDTLTDYNAIDPTTITVNNFISMFNEYLTSKSRYEELKVDENYINCKNSYQSIKNEFSEFTKIWDLTSFSEDITGDDEENKILQKKEYDIFIKNIKNQNQTNVASSSSWEDWDSDNEDDNDDNIDNNQILKEFEEKRNNRDIALNNLNNFKLKEIKKLMETNLNICEDFLKNIHTNPSYQSISDRKSLFVSIVKNINEDSYEIYANLILSSCKREFYEYVIREINSLRIKKNKKNKNKK